MTVKISQSLGSSPISLGMNTCLSSCPCTNQPFCWCYVMQACSHSSMALGKWMGQWMDRQLKQIPQSMDNQFKIGLAHPTQFHTGMIQQSGINHGLRERVCPNLPPHLHHWQQDTHGVGNKMEDLLFQKQFSWIGQLLWEVKSLFFRLKSLMK